MSVSNTAPSFVVRSRGEFAAWLPSLIGFHSEGALVVVFLDDGKVSLSMRLDLEYLSSDSDDVTRQIRNAARQSCAGELLIAVYCPRGGGAYPFQDEVESLVSRCEVEGLVCRDALLVDAGRYWSYLCRGEACCPPEGAVIARRRGSAGVVTTGARGGRR